MQYGIPEFRLNKELVNKEIKSVIENNNYIEVQLNTVLVKQKSDNSKYQEVTIDELKQNGFTHICISIGNEISNSSKIKGIDSKYVIKANDFLKTEYSDEEFKDKIFAIFGGGNVAIDSARKAVRLGSKVIDYYRKSKDDMKANKAELTEALEEGVVFTFFSVLKEITEQEGNHNLLLTIEQTLGDKKSEIQTEADYVVEAIGSKLNTKYLDDRIKIDENGKIIIDENYETSLQNVYAIGDLANARGTVAWAIRAGKNMAEYITQLHK